MTAIERNSEPKKLNGQQGHDLEEGMQTTLGQGCFSTWLSKFLPRSAQSSLGPRPHLCLFSMVVEAEVGG